jgi:hypothetical protein
MPAEVMTAYEALMQVEVDDSVSVLIEDFDNTRFPKDENPRTVSGEIAKINESVGGYGGEVQRRIVVGNPMDDGCVVDLGDTAENKLVSGGSSRTWMKAWRPRPGKDRLLLGQVAAMEVNE